MHHLTKPVYKHHYLGVAGLSHGEVGDHISTDALPPSPRDLQWLQQTTWFLTAVCFVFLTFRAVSDLLTHAFRPVQPFHGLLSLEYQKKKKKKKPKMMGGRAARASTAVQVFDCLG